MNDKYCGYQRVTDCMTDDMLTNMMHDTGPTLGSWLHDSLCLHDSLVWLQPGLATLRLGHIP